MLLPWPCPSFSSSSYPKKCYKNCIKLKHTQCIWLFSQQNHKILTYWPNIFMSLAVPLIINFENHELFTPGLTSGFLRNIKWLWVQFYFQLRSLNGGLKRRYQIAFCYTNFKIVNYPSSPEIWNMIVLKKWFLEQFLIFRRGPVMGVFKIPYFRMRTFKISIFGQSHKFLAKFSCHLFTDLIFETDQK